MTANARIRSFRYVSVEPTEHRTTCAQCSKPFEDVVMYLMRVRHAVDYGAVDQPSPSWFVACLSCYAEIEQRAVGGTRGVPPPVRAIATHKQANGLPLYVAHSGAWNEDADLWNEVDE